MNSILIDLTTLNKDELQMASYGIKLFFHKIKDLSLIVVGESNNLLTIKDLTNVEVIDSTNDENKLNEVIINKEFSTFVSFRNKSKIVEIANNNFQKIIDSPLYATFFANAYTGRMTLLGDIGYKSFSTKDDFISYKETLKITYKELYENKDAKFKFLLTSNLKKSEETKEIVSILKNDNNFDGEIGTNYLLEADTDILLGDATIIQATISGINQGVTVYNEYLEKGMKTSFQYKFGGFFVKKLMESFNSSIDKKITSGGMMLLGYNKNIVAIRNDTTSIDVSSCLNLAYKMTQTNFASKIK